MSFSFCCLIKVTKALVFEGLFFIFHNFTVYTFAFCDIIRTNVLKGGLSMKGLFLRSIENKEKIIIFYMDSNNNVTERYIRVLNIKENYILAYCYYRKQVRTFKLDNILSAGLDRKGA